jgi:hypothetical protein
MNVSFGNLTQPKHNTNYHDSKQKLSEMMIELERAGFNRVDNTSDAQKGDKNYHIYDMPHKIEITTDVDEAVKIMTPYSNYMLPMQVVSLEPAL